jgi:hypothetical protein
MSTNVLHEVHPWGPRFPVSGHDWRTVNDEAVQARQERAPIRRCPYIVESAEHLRVGFRSPRSGG